MKLWVGLKTQQADRQDDGQLWLAHRLVLKMTANRRPVKENGLSLTTGCSDGQMTGPFYLTYCILPLFKMFI